MDPVHSNFFKIMWASLPNSVAHCGKFSTYSNAFSSTPEPGQVHSIVQYFQYSACESFSGSHVFHGAIMYTCTCSNVFFTAA